TRSRTGSVMSFTRAQAAPGNAVKTRKNVVAPSRTNDGTRARNGSIEKASASGETVRRSSQQRVGEKLDAAGAKKFPRSQRTGHPGKKDVNSLPTDGKLAGQPRGPGAAATALNNGSVTQPA